ncbi:ABC transporter permease [Patescibacteria group bacterium]|nr:ABC transporter permease [Patescibacteria group bacterium]MBU1931437.1 ABC transporter permease [Patescibacteria group bacterium]
MDYKELVLESFSTLTLNKVRTGLAMLGVVIGIGSVIALVSLGQASQRSIEEQIRTLGSNLLTVSPGSQRSGGVRGAAGGGQTLIYNDAKAIMNSPQVTTVTKVSPEYSGREQIVAGRNNTNTQVVGVTPEYTEVRNVDVSSGFFISQQNLNSMSKVAVLGPQTAVDLFGEGVDPVGKNIRIKGLTFRVVGITTSKGGGGFMNQDDRIYVPLTTAQKQLFGVDYLSSISIEVMNQDVMVEAQNQVGYLLLDRHKLNDPAQADFSIMSQADIIGTATEVTGTFTTLLSGIAAISLIVGGIGIMNIMLVTVTERTREIGLRKALGAKKKVINAQFLLEAVMVTFVGGLIGIVLGVGVAYALSRSMSLPFALSIPSILLAFGVSAAIGVLFGWYPAQKAANLQPIEALRYE